MEPLTLDFSGVEATIAKQVEEALERSFVAPLRAQGFDVNVRNLAEEVAAKTQERLADITKQLTPHVTEVYREFLRLLTTASARQAFIYAGEYNVVWPALTELYASRKDNDQFLRNTSATWTRIQAEEPTITVKGNIWSIEWSPLTLARVKWFTEGTDKQQARPAHDVLWAVLATSFTQQLEAKV